MSSEQEEWCLTVQLEGQAEEIERVASRLAELLGGRVTRDRATFRVYSDSEAQAAETESRVLSTVEETSLGYELWQERWDDEAGAWEELAPEAPDDEGRSEP